MTDTFVRPAARLLAALTRSRHREQRPPEPPPADRGPGTPELWLAALRLWG
ncbi:hypothetical protein [Streptomyces brasiliensis]|uniref:Uncharacterized protein n=1 Tax=Streptomyces brasiliensis TaxID=1954 RepID=A0A917K9R1_9ACTN|nr:hypothetical protein [Streptomyces brasiliensis]GGJ06121.1 hypothetical protein GCM10010121_015690 [Streptomyces brasiliensis]